VRELNQEYNLGLHLGDPDDTRTFTVNEAKDLARRDLNFQRWHQTVNDVRFLHYQRAWEKALRAFRREAKAVSRDWIHKSGSDPDLLPSSAEPYQAKTLGEQVELQDLLLEQIKKVKDLVQASGSAQAGPQESAVPARANGTRAKRQSTELTVEIPAGASKRRKSQGEQTKARAVFSSIDKIPIRQKVTLPRKKSSALSAIAPGRSFYNQSENTSKSSFQPSIFSAAGIDGVQASQRTQTTVPNDSQPVSKLFRQPVPPSSIDLFAPSSGDVEALEDSFSRLVKEQALEDTDDVPSEDPREWAQFESEQPTIPRRDVAQDKGGSTVILSTKYSSPAASQEETTFVPELRTPTPLDTRLKGVWRRLLCSSLI
jgi:hypothetical protein